jgi:metal-responsive CopG/Arc/MetJ family transcriptional regulator
MVTTTLELPDELAQLLDEAADRTGKSRGELISEALRTYLRDEARRLPRSFGAYADPELSGADSEDWLRANWRPT